MANSAVVGILRAVLTADTAQFEAAMKSASDSAKVWTKDLNNIGRQATQIGASLTKAITVPILGLAAGSIKAAMDFESSFANVRKTVDATDEQLDGLAMAFRQMAKEIPATTDELNAIAALGGQMGVPIDQMEKFTRHVAALGVAVDGISTEEAAAGLAQIGNIAGTGTTHIDKMASSLVHLGNSSNATESDILEFTKRLMGAGASAGMTVPEVMAIGTAMANVGINAEAGGTAMSTMIAKMSMAVSTGGESLESFAKVAGVSGQEFARIWRTSAVSAVDLVVQGLGRMKGEGADLNLVVRDIGATNIRTADTMKRLALAGDGVSTSLITSNEGWETGNKHLTEAEKKYATTANQLKLLWSNIKDLGITIGGTLLPVLNDMVRAVQRVIPFVDSLAKGFAALPDSIQLVAFGALALPAVLGPVIWSFGQLATLASTLVGAFAKKGLAMKALEPIGQGLMRVFGPLFGTMSGGAGALSLVTRAFAAFMGPVGWIIGGAATLLTVTGSWDEFFRILKAGVQIVYNIAAAIGSWAMEAIKWFGDVTGLTDHVIAVFQGFVEVLKFVGNGIEWFLDKAADAMESIAAITGGIERDLNAADIASPFKKLVGEGLGPALTASEALAQFQADEQKKAAEAAARALAAEQKAAEENAKAKQEAEKRSQELAAAIDRLADSAKALGLITRDQVNEEIGELMLSFSGAMRGGVALDRALPPLIAKLKELAAKASASGHDVSALNADILQLEGRLKTLRGAPPVLPAHLFRSGEDGLANLLSGFEAVSAEQLQAGADSRILASAHETLGIRSRADLERTAAAARQAYLDILNSGTATADQLEAARERVLEAERAAGRETVNIWDTQIGQGISRAVDGIVGSVTSGLVDMIGHWNRHGEILKGIWQGIKNTFLNVLDEMLSSFINGFLKGLIESIVGANLGQRLAQSLLGNGASAAVNVGTGTGSAAGAGTGAGSAFGYGAAQVGTTIAIFDALLPGDKGVIESLIDFDAPPTQPLPEDEARALFESYFGPDYERFLGNDFDFSNFIPGSGTIPGLDSGGWVLEDGLAMVHAGERVEPATVAPLDRVGRGGNMTVILERDGRAEAQWLVPFLPDEVRRLRLA